MPVAQTRTTHSPLALHPAPISPQLSTSVDVEKRSTVTSDWCNHSILELKVNDWIQLVHVLHFPCEKTPAAEVISMVSLGHMYLFEEAAFVRL